MTARGRSEDELNSAEELDRLREMFARSPSFSALLHGPEHRFLLTNPAYHQLIGHRNVVGLPVREAVPEVEGQGFFELLDNVFATGEPFVGKDVKIVLQRTPGGIVAMNGNHAGPDPQSSLKDRDGFNRISRPMFATLSPTIILARGAS